MTTRVVEAVDMPDTPRPPARRKGPGGRWEQLVDGKWIGVSTSPDKPGRAPTARQREIWEAVARHGTQLAAAKALGVGQGTIQGALAGYMRAMGIDGPMPGKLPAGSRRAPSARFDNDHDGRTGDIPWSGKTAIEPEPGPLADAAPNVNRNGHVPGRAPERPIPQLPSLPELPEIPELPAEPLETSTDSYDQGFAVGFMAGVLTVLAEDGASPGAGLRGAARRALQLLEAAP